MCTTEWPLGIVVQSRGDLSSLLQPFTREATGKPLAEFGSQRRLGIEVQTRGQLQTHLQLGRTCRRPEKETAAVKQTYGVAELTGEKPALAQAGSEGKRYARFPPRLHCLKGWTGSDVIPPRRDRDRRKRDFRASSRRGKTRSDVSAGHLHRRWEASAIFEASPFKEVSWREAAKR